MYIYKSSLSNTEFLENTSDLAMAYKNQLDDICSAFRGTPIETLKYSKLALFDNTGDREIYQTDYFKRRERLVAFSIRSWLYGEKADIDELCDILWAICDEYTWALPAHIGGITRNSDVSRYCIDLFACETAQAISETLSICEDYIPELIKKRCIDEIMKRVIMSFETGDTEKYRFGWEKADNNWAAVCGGSIGIVAMYLVEDNARMNKILSRAIDSANRFFNKCNNDGSWEEGVYYWMYAMQYYVALDEMCREKLGKSIVPDFDKMKKTASLPSAVCFSDGNRITFSDCGEVHLYFGILARLAKRYDVSIPDKRYYSELIDSCARFCGAVRNIAWFDDTVISENTAQNDVFFPDGQWAIMHSDSTTVAIKGGNNAEMHNHNDVGSYMYICNGHIIADDLGAPVYDADYFGKKRYENLNTSSRGHNVPVVNGYFQHEGKEFFADRFQENKNGIEVSFAKAYDKKSELQSLVRYMNLDKKSGTVTISDEFEFKNLQNSVKERIVTKYAVAVLDNTAYVKDREKDIAKIEFLCNGEIRIIQDSYIANNTDKKQNVNIIEFKTNMDNSGNVSYKIIAV
ncbi:MAG: heparinase II/III family protein [Clostridia bacterium]|nr:heparinase II/III family protein [Clostridia bacterium]